jgi:hypothetical protein
MSFKESGAAINIRVPLPAFRLHLCGIVASNPNLLCNHTRVQNPSRLLRILICHCKHYNSRTPAGLSLLWRRPGFTNGASPLQDKGYLWRITGSTQIVCPFSLAYDGLFKGGSNGDLHCANQGSIYTGYNTASLHSAIHPSRSLQYSKSTQHLFLGLYLPHHSTKVST